MPGLALVILHLAEGMGPALTLFAAQRLIDAAIAGFGTGIAGLRAVLPWLALFGAALLLSQEIVWRFRNTLLLRVRQRLEHALGRRLLAKAARLPLVFFEETTTYDRLVRANNPGAKVADLYFAVLRFVLAVVEAVSVAALFWSVSPWMTVVLLVITLPHAILHAEQSRRFLSFHYGWTEEQRRVTYLDGLLTGRAEQKEIRMFNLARPLVQRWQAMRLTLRAHLLRQKRSEIVYGVPVFAMAYVVSLGVAVALALALARRSLTPGGFVTLFRGVDRMDSAAFGLGYNVREMHTQAVEVGYVREFLDQPEEPHSRGAERFPRPLRIGIRLEEVSFTYPGRPQPALRSVDLHLRPGERVALVGENGAGKSTLARLLLGLYRPTTGRITVDGLDYAAIAPESLHDNVSAAFQDYCNFELTAAHAIAVGDPRAFAGAGRASWDGLPAPDLERVRAAAQRGGAHEMIATLPFGYETPIGHVLEGGRGLSGGQWQRLAISRACMRDPLLLILDEPTASLDPQAEAEVYAQFARLLAGRMALLISHRLGSARLADRIIVMKEGRIVEDGDHNTLLKAGGEYARMWEEQAQWYR